MSEQSAASLCQVGILHPGQMGVSIAAAVQSAGHTVNWVSEGRSADSISRAERAGLTDLANLESICGQCQYILSVCPPEQARAVAQQVADREFAGVYIDCNAVSPDSSRAVAEVLADTKASYVDGGIIGPPAARHGTTRLYLSGDQGNVVAGLFAGSVVDAIVLDDVIGSASALKMAYAGWTKGSSALLMNQFALARQQNVEKALLNEWAISLPGVYEQLQGAARGSAPKAWRFVGEMHEIADTLDASGLSRLWFDGAADTYSRLVSFKNSKDCSTEQVIDALVADSVPTSD